MRATSTPGVIASERVSGCAQLVFGEGTPEATTGFERGRELLLTDGWDGVCAWVAEMLTVKDLEERTRRQNATEKLLGYFAKHTRRLNYRERLASGRAIDSGVVEGQAKTLGLWLKARGTVAQEERPAHGQLGLCTQLHAMERLLGVGGLNQRIWIHPLYRHRD